MVDTCAICYDCDSRQAVNLCEVFDLAPGDPLPDPGAEPEEDELGGDKPDRMPGELEDTRGRWGDLDLPSYSLSMLGNNGLSIERWRGSCKELGSVSVERFDNQWRLRVERSIPKWLDGENCRLLTAREAQEGIYAMDEAVRSMAPFVHRETARLTRVDVYYQLRVPDSRDLMRMVHAAIEPRWSRKCVRYDTGLVYEGQQRRFRLYDKGVESKNEEYCNVVRLEEQVRKGGKAMARLSDGLKVDTIEARALINERVKQFLDCTFTPVPVQELMQQKEWCLLYLVSHPEAWATYKATVTRQSAAPMLKRAKRMMAESIGVELQVPEDAWMSN